MTSALPPPPGDPRAALFDAVRAGDVARAGGTIYIWTLGAGKSAHAVARAFGYEGVFRLLMERSPAALQLTVAAGASRSRWCTRATS